MEPFAASGNNLQGGVQCDGLPDETAGAPHNCTLYRETENFGYSTSIVIAPFSGSGALSRTVLAARVSAGKWDERATIGDIVKRLVNGLGVGQADGPGVGRGRLAVRLQREHVRRFDDRLEHDGAAGRAAAGVAMPAYIGTEFNNFAYIQHKNTDGSFDYTAEQQRGLRGIPGTPRGGCRPGRRLPRRRISSAIPM